MERRNAFDYSRRMVARFYVSLAIVSTCSILAARPEEDPRAQYNRGTGYWYGSGVPQDYVEAANWFRKAAEGGFAEAQYRLAQMMAIGQGIRQDNTEAANWYRKAAEQGVVGAQFNLG
ncbi:MAG TPA: tetratricopeptide repeat protein, partial [Bryobacteraceae bacterium]